MVLTLVMAIFQRNEACWLSELTQNHLAAGRRFGVNLRHMGAHKGLQEDGLGSQALPSSISYGLVEVFSCLACPLL